MNKEQIEIYKAFEKRGLERSSACKDAIERAGGVEQARTCAKIDLISDGGICYGVIEIPIA